MMKKDYSLIYCVFDNYDNIHKPLYFDTCCEYIVVTDNKDYYIGDNFKYIYFNDRKLTGREKLQYVRTHIFEFCKTNFAFYLDSNVQILNSLLPIYEKSKNNDISLCSYFYLLDNFKKLVNFLNDKNRLNKYDLNVITEYIDKKHIDVNKLGLVTYKFFGVKKNSKSHKFMESIYDDLKKLDNFYFDELQLNYWLNYTNHGLKLFMYHNDIFYSEYFNLYKHRSDELLIDDYNIIYNNCPIFNYPYFYKNTQYSFEKL